MPTLHTMVAFAVVSLVITVVPGPSTFFVLSQGLVRGRRSALSAMVGIEIASAIRVVVTAAGVSALLASSVVAFEALRWAGVAYLAFLGVRALTAESREESAASVSVTRLIRKGVLVGLGNPKMAVFFLALLPQFIHRAQGSAAEQILLLGAIFWIIGVLWDLVIALASGSLSSWLQDRPRVRAVRRRIEGGAYLVLAGWGALTGE